MTPSVLSQVSITTVTGATLPLVRSEKIQSAHWERLAIVYVRQSTMQQVLEHQESTRLQYSLKSRASQLGWHGERVLVIDDDLGKSGATAEGRAGFQRLVTEVTLGHVGIILGVEMSRLARSCKDWHQLLEACALFGTLIADLDGIYDPAQYNDRLLLGLKGTMSEAELHIIKQRMSQGRLSKARRGELGKLLPTGYVRRPSGEITKDPDERVQSVVETIFRKFEELGTLNAVLRYMVKNSIQLGIRVREGPAKGELEWHRPSRMTLQNLLHNPIYAGAYAYGRRQIEARRKKPGRPSTGRRVMNPDQWLVLLKARYPAYISWEQYEANLARLKSNQLRADEVGPVRNGAALLSGLVVCAKCGCRMTVRYSSHNNYQTYVCTRAMSDYGGSVCQTISGRALDKYLSEQVLEALAPAPLELSLEVAKNLERERQEVRKLWEQRLERAFYEVERTARQYRLVEPENRLVARQLEREWEEKLQYHKKLEEEWNRAERNQPRMLSTAEEEAIRRLAEDIPSLWSAAATTDADRKEILRQVIERVVLDVRGQSEVVQISVEWKGGIRTTCEMVKPVAKQEQLTYYPQLCERIRALASEGLRAATIAERLNDEGFQPPKRRKVFNREGVLRIMHRLGIARIQRHSCARPALNDNEWLLADLALQISMPAITLHSWVKRGWVKSRKETGPNGRWIIWADKSELDSLKERKSRPQGYYTRRLFLDDKIEEDMNQ